jgi:superfamily II RNA helicase
MTLKQAALKRDISQEHSASPNAAADSPESSLREAVTEAPAKDEQPIPPEISALISDEVLRHRIRSFIEPKPTPSWFQRFINSQVFLTFLGFLLTGVIGGALTYLYTAKQQELTSQRSFSDELNKIRIQKIGEVWEQIDKTEPDIDQLLDKINKSPDSNNKLAFENIQKIINEDVALINKNKFWLGEQSYNRIKDYLDISSQYTLDKITGRPGIDLSDTVRRREQAKQDILQIRKMFLNGEPNP